VIRLVCRRGSGLARLANHMSGSVEDIWRAAHAATLVKREVKSWAGDSERLAINTGGTIPNQCTIRGRSIAPSRKTGLTVSVVHLVGRVLNVDFGKDSEGWRRPAPAEGCFGSVVKTGDLLLRSDREICSE